MQFFFEMVKTLTVVMFPILFSSPYNMFSFLRSRDYACLQTLMNVPHHRAMPMPTAQTLWVYLPVLVTAVTPETAEAVQVSFLVLGSLRLWSESGICSLKILQTAVHQNE